MSTILFLIGGGGLGLLNVGLAVSDGNIHAALGWIASSCFATATYFALRIQKK